MLDALAAFVLPEVNQFKSKLPEQVSAYHRCFFQIIAQSGQKVMDDNLASLRAGPYVGTGNAERQPSTESARKASNASDPKLPHACRIERRRGSRNQPFKFRA